MDAAVVSKPRTVGIAVLILSLALTIGLIRSFIRLDNIAMPFSPTLAYAMLLFAFGVVALFVYKIFQGRNWARIVYLVLMLLGLFRAVPTLISTFDSSPVSAILSALVLAAQLVALFLLFTGASNAWFRRHEP